MVAKLIQFVKKYQTDIVLFVGVILISLLSYAVGYIVAEGQEGESLQFETYDQVQD